MHHVKIVYGYHFEKNLHIDLPFVLHQPSHHRRTDSRGGKFAKNIDIIHGCFLYLPNGDRRSVLSAPLQSRKLQYTLIHIYMMTSN